jgi:hypothetical protein
MTVSSLSVKYQIWNKSTNDLYDFESEDFVKGELRLDRDQHLLITESNKIVPFADNAKLIEHLSTYSNDKVITSVNFLASNIPLV